MTLRNFLQNKQRDVRYTAKNFEKSSFSVVAKFRNARWVIWYEFKRNKSIFADNGSSEQGLGHLLIITSNYHFFNKIDLELHFFRTPNSLYREHGESFYLAFVVIVL